jgi:hypothetical protein
MPKVSISRSYQNLKLRKEVEKTREEKVLYPYDP